MQIYLPIAEVSVNAFLLLGLGGMVSSNKNFVGAALLKRAAYHEEGRLQLVAMKSIDGQKVTGGSHLLAAGSTEDNPGQTMGHTTSACFSPELGVYVSLGLLANGAARHGEIMTAASPVRNSYVAVEIIPPHMIDPEGKRMHG